MDLELIKEIVNFFNESGLKNLTVRSEKLDLSMEAFPPLPSFSGQMHPMKELSEIQIKLDNTIDAPMVGVFYRSAGPNEKPFVSAGDSVKKGDTLCIIEAMKVMTEVKAKRDGKIKKVNVNDGDPIEFGKPLFVLE
jgi:acetyl-CoA carboxylase biotin carboxyl carrier protein